MIARTTILCVALVGCGKRNFNEVDAGEPSVVCPASYTSVAGAGNLKYSPRPVTNTSWVSAHMTCLNEGTRLAIPTSRYEALALRDVASTGRLWIGVSTIDTGGVWTTVYDLPATYLPWDVADGEPNGTGECGYLDPEGEFNDGTCTELLPAICECRGQ